MYSQLLTDLYERSRSENNADRCFQLLLISFFRTQMNHSQASAEARVDNLEQYLRART